MYYTILIINLSMQNKVTTKTSITKQIVFPKKLIDLAESKYSRMGLNLPEYLRHLIIKDVEDLSNLPMVDEQTEKAIGRSMEDLAAGRYTVLSSTEEIEEHFKKLDDDE